MFCTKNLRTSDFVTPLVTKAEKEQRYNPKPLRRWARFFPIMNRCTASECQGRMGCRCPEGAGKVGSPGQGKQRKSCPVLRPVHRAISRVLQSVYETKLVHRKSSDISQMPAGQDRRSWTESEPPPCVRHLGARCKPRELTHCRD